MASTEADRSCSENYTSPLIVSGWYILLQVEIPVFIQRKIDLSRKKNQTILMMFKLLKSLLTSRSKIHIDSGAFVSSLEVSWGK